MKQSAIYKVFVVIVKSQAAPTNTDMRESNQPSQLLHIGVDIVKAAFIFESQYHIITK